MKIKNCIMDDVGRLILEYLIYFVDFDKFLVNANIKSSGLGHSFVVVICDELQRGVCG